MKKLIVVALALVIACVFVGCGAGALLEGTQWYEELLMTELHTERTGLLKKIMYSSSLKQL